jgi:hypothetical protein
MTRRTRDAISMSSGESDNERGNGALPRADHSVALDPFVCALVQVDEEERQSPHGERPERLILGGQHRGGGEPIGERVHQG